MKTLLAGLQNNVSTSLSDLTKTFTGGRAIQKTVDGLQVTAPPLTTFSDVFTLTGITPSYCVYNPTTGRKFELQNITTNTPVVLAFNFNSSLGTWTLIGKITLNLPPGAHTQRGFTFDDSDENNIKLILSSTIATALVQGGTYYTWNLPLTDFTLSGTTIYMANGTNQKGVYFAQNPSEVGRAHAGTTAGGVAAANNATVLANKSKFYQQNGAAATMQIYEFDTSLGNPSIEGTITDGVSAQTTSYAGTSPAAYFTMGASQNGYSTVTPTSAAFEAVILQNGTNVIPTNFVATTTIQTQYFIRDLQQVGGIWYFNLATTSTGATVIPTLTTASFTMMRASGISTTHFSKKTGIITPALTGTLLQAHSFGFSIPTNAPVAPALNGQDCLFISTSTTLYMGKLSDLVNGGTSWSSFSGVNILGTGVDITVPTTLFARYSTTLDRWVYATNTSKFIIKKHQPNSIDRVFGSLINTYYEAQNPVAVPAGLSAISSISVSDGWLFIVGSTTGQRGVVSCDIYSDSLFDYSYVVSPVLNVETGSLLKYISTIEGYYDYTDTMNFYIKSSSNPTDPIFSTNSGWTPIAAAADNSPQALGPYFRIKVTYNNATYGNNTPPQLSELIVTYESPNEISDNWEFSRDLSDNTSPSRCAFRLKEAYASSVPTLHFRANDLSNTNLVDHTTTANAANFEYSTDNGVTWLPLGTIPNTVGTILRYTFTSPPGVDIRPSIRES